MIMQIFLNFFWFSSILKKMFLVNSTIKFILKNSRKILINSPKIKYRQHFIDWIKQIFLKIYLTNFHDVGAVRARRNEPPFHGWTSNKIPLFLNNFPLVKRSGSVRPGGHFHRVTCRLFFKKKLKNWRNGRLPLEDPPGRMSSHFSRSEPWRYRYDVVDNWPENSSAVWVANESSFA